jgi:hypothetical protein
MKIIETEILDLGSKNLDLEKVKLSEKIIKKIAPILDKSYYENLLEVNELKSKVKIKRETVLKEKKNILNLIASYERKKKVTNLLNGISNLLNVRIPDGSLKKELVVLVKIAEKLDTKKLDSYIKSVTKK